MIDLESQVAKAVAGSAKDRVDLAVGLALFLDLSPGVETAGGTAAVRLPASLAWFYAGLGKGGRRPWQNPILDRAGVHARDGKLVFAVENQGVYSWATDGDSDDPHVHGRFEETDPWRREEPRLSTFLLQLTLLELLAGARHCAAHSCMAPSTFAAIAADLRTADLPAWRWPAYPARFHLRGNAIAFVCPNVTPGESATDPWLSFWVGAAQVEDLAFVRTYLDSTWEEVLE